MSMKKNILSKLIISSVVVGSLAIGGNAFAAQIRINNHTANGMHVWCTKGKCNYLHEFKDFNIPANESHLSDVDTDFTANFSVRTDAGQCNFEVTQVPSHTSQTWGRLSVDLAEAAGSPGCTGIKFTGLKHQETSDPKGIIVLEIENDALKAK